MSGYLDTLIGCVVRVHHPSMIRNPVGIVTEFSASHIVVQPIANHAADRRALPPLILPTGTTVLTLYGPAEQKHLELIAAYEHPDYVKQL